MSNMPSNAAGVIAYTFAGDGIDVGVSVIVGVDVRMGNVMLGTADGASTVM